MPRRIAPRGLGLRRSCLRQLLVAHHKWIILLSTFSTHSAPPKLPSAKSAKTDPPYGAFTVGHHQLPDQYIMFLERT